MTLDEVQTLMDDLYGAADRERGIPATVAWLCEELGELAQAVRKGSIQALFSCRTVIRLILFNL